jgi:predicted metal-dependent phosphoesterase TrpH
MNKQEPTAEQEKLQYTVEKPHPFWPMITTADGRNIISIQEFADELNELVGQRDKAIEERDAALAEVERLRCSFSEYDNRIQQELGKKLGYPWFKDSQEHFPGATEASGVCVGDHVGGTLAIEAAEKIRDLRAEVEKLKEQLYAEIKKNTITIPIRPEPSRLEIAAMLLSGAMADPSVEGSCINHTWFLRQADALIAAAKEEPSK